MSANNKDVDIMMTVKDKDGHTYDSVESLDFEVKVSGNSSTIRIL